MRHRYGCGVLTGMLGALAAHVVPLAAGEAVAAVGAAQGSAIVASAGDELERARWLLEARMPVSAAELLTEALAAGRVAGDEAVVLTARALGDQRAWNGLRAFLSRNEVSSERGRLDARLLLAEAHAGLDAPAQAAEHYRAYLAGAAGVPDADVRVGYAQALIELFDWPGAAEQFALAETEHPDLGPWLRLARLEALVDGSDPAAFALADSIVSAGRVAAGFVLLPAARLAFQLDEPERGVALAGRANKGVRDALAARYLGPHYEAVDDTAAAADAFAAGIAAGVYTSSTGPALLELRRTWRTLRDVGRSDSRAGRHSRALRYLEEAIALAPASERPALAEALAGAHLALNQPSNALAELAPWLEEAGQMNPRASLWMLASRAYSALGRSGDAERARATAARGSGAVAARAAYLLADLDHDDGRPEAAAEQFLRAHDAFPGSDYGARSLERRAMLDFHSGRYAEAEGHIARYRERYPDGEWGLGAVYWSGKVAGALGDEAGERAFYEEAVRRDPMDYYAILAAERLGRDRWSALALRDSDPLPEVAPIHAEALRTMNALRGLGWTSHAKREYDRAREAGPSSYGQVLAWAHALNAAGWTFEGVRQGWRAQAMRRGWSRQLLEAIYPLPYREALVDAARRNGLPPHFVAGLSRRESLFDPEIRSPANAYGLMQLLPETAEDVAPRAGLPRYARRQLTVPQVNLLLGTRYLAEVIEEYDGFGIAGMISYNAGPHRYAAWRGFPEFRDAEQLVERIPYRETREYVRAVTELAEIYRFLYPELSATLPEDVGAGTSGF